MKMGHVKHRRLAQKAKAAGIARVAETAGMLFDKRFKAVKRDLRRSNLKKRLAKTQGLYKDGVQDWQEWTAAFSTLLSQAIEEGIASMYDVENEFWRSYGQAPTTYAPTEVLHAYEDRIGRQIKNIADDTLADTQQAISEWYLTDQGLPELLDQLEQYYSPARAELIGYTEMSGVASQVALDVMTQYNVPKWLWDAGGEACPECQDLQANNPYVPGDPMPPDASHPHCVIPGQMVDIQNLSGGFKSFYQGVVIEFSTRSGRKLTVTPNHPILSSLTGWKAADLFRVGDYFVTHSNSKERVYSVSPYNHAGPSIIEKVFEALKMTSGMTTKAMPVTTEDFNGDARCFNGNIEIVIPDRQLRSALDTALTQAINNQALDGVIRTFLEPKIGVQNLFLIGDSATPNSSVSSVGPLRPLLRSKSRIFQALDFTERPFLDVVFSENPSDDRSTNTDGLRNFILGNSASIERDEIVNIRRYDFSGHVYDLSSDFYGMYLCNDIILHNCLCSVVYADANGEAI
jgi:hypothetical protein